MKNLLKPILIVGGLLTIFSLAACSSGTPDGTRPAGVTATATHTRTPAPSPTFTATATPSPTASPTPTATPLPPCTPTPTGMVYVLENSVYLDVNAGLEMGVWEAIEVLQQALEQRAPAWAQYRWQDSKGREHTLAEYFWDVSGAQRIGVNPRVLLVTAGMALDWQIPAGKDLRRAISEVGVALNEHYLAFRFDEDLRARYPQVVNAANYALYAFFGYDLEKLKIWEQEYDRLFGEWQPRLPPTMCYPASENK